MDFFMSILLGLIPETLFFTLFLIYTKGIKEKKVRLFILIAISYLLCIMIIRHKMFYYVCYIIMIYISLKILYKAKAQIIDIFVISIALIYVAFISAICFAFVKENYVMYYIMFILDRILLFVPFIFKNKYNNIYKKYCSLWNRNDSIKRPIKSITLRNISLIVLNIFIFICDVVCLYTLSLK